MFLSSLSRLLLYIISCMFSIGNNTSIVNLQINSGGIIYAMMSPRDIDYAMMSPRDIDFLKFIAIFSFPFSTNRSSSSSLLGYKFPRC